MPPIIRQLCTLLGIVAMLVASVPVGAAGPVEDQTPNDTCCTDGPPCEPSDEAVGTSLPLDGDCCPSGCKDCFLQCCNGLLSLHAFSVTVETHLPSHRTKPEGDDQVFPTDPRAVYHPPRH